RGAFLGEAAESRRPSRLHGGDPGLERRHPGGWTSGLQPLEWWHQNRGAAPAPIVEYGFFALLIAAGLARETSPWGWFCGGGGWRSEERRVGRGRSGDGTAGNLPAGREAASGPTG